jgi:hypothetical protein
LAGTFILTLGLLVAVGYYYWIMYKSQPVQAIETIQKDNGKDPVPHSSLGTDNLLDKALRSLTRPNHAGYPYDSEQEKIMFQYWTPLSK